MTAMTPTAIPTPIPAEAPLESPKLEEVVFDGAGEDILANTDVEEKD
jgi:hypothetical protein